MTGDVGRRKFLMELGADSGLALAGCKPWPGGWGSGHHGHPVHPIHPVHPGTIRQPGDRPDPRRPEGVDCLPPISHIVIYMQENHSYDSYFGTFPRGDGFTMKHGVPLNSCVDVEGRVVPVTHAPDTCQQGRGVSQNWVSTHRQIDGGRMDGFLFDDNYNAMRYWDGTDLPFYWSLASTFPLCDRWFASAPAQTYPNRMYLQAATCQDLISTDTSKVPLMPHPAGGTIWDKLNAFGIPWIDYAFDLPDVLLFAKTFNANVDKIKNFPQFLADCAAGTLPSVSIVSPGVAAYTEENPADIQLGEAFSSSVINAVMHSPAWPKTALFFMYDEHGGYYDHVTPPAAIPPDDIRPAVGRDRGRRRHVVVVATVLVVHEEQRGLRPRGAVHHRVDHRRAEGLAELDVGRVLLGVRGDAGAHDRDRRQRARRAVGEELREVLDLVDVGVERLGEQQHVGQVERVVLPRDPERVELVPDGAAG